MSISVVDDSRYFRYNFTADQFYVESRIDIDEGLQSVQTMLLLCQPKQGPSLEVRPPALVTPDALCYTST